MAVAGALTILMGGGYFASQAAYFQESTAGYIKAIDASPIRWIALALLAAVIILSLIPEREEGAS